MRSIETISERIQMLNLDFKSIIASENEKKLFFKEFMFNELKA